MVAPSCADIYFGGTKTQWEPFNVVTQARVHYEMSDPGDTNIIKFQVEGGYIYFNKETRTIIDCDKTVVSALIPRQIDSRDVWAIGDRAFEDCILLSGVSFPDTVKSIMAYAFSNCLVLDDVVIPSNVEVIGEGTFSGCKALSRIMIPKEVTHIKQNTFNDCGSLHNVYYGGTKTEWNKIEIDEGNDAIRSSLINTWKYFSFNNSTRCIGTDKNTKGHDTGGIYYEHLRSLLDEHYGSHFFWSFDEFVKRSRIWKKKNIAPWGGCCYGFVAIEGMVNALGYPVSAIDGKSSSIEQVKAPADTPKDSRVLNLLEYYYLTQLLPWEPFNNQCREVGTKEGEAELRKLTDNVLNGTPCMFNYFFTNENDNEYGHTFIVEGGERLSDGTIRLFGQDNRYHGRSIRWGEIEGEPKTRLELSPVIITITPDYGSCTITKPDNGDEKKTTKEFVKSVDIISSFDCYLNIDPTGSVAAVQLLDENVPEKAPCLFYYLPDSAAVNKLTLNRPGATVLQGGEAKAGSDGVKSIRYIARGSDEPAGVMMELDPGSTAYTVSNFDGICAYVGPESSAIISVKKGSEASAEINLTDNTVTLTNNTGEFSITVATPESADTFATVSGSTDTAGETVTVTTTTNGDVTVDAPTGDYDVTFEDEYGDEYTTTATVTEAGKNVTVENPATPIPCNAGYTAEITWNGTAYTVALTGNGGASNLTAWQVCYDKQGKMLSTAVLTGTEDNGGMSFSGKATSEGTCYLFIVDGNNAPVIQKYNLTKYAGGK